MKKGTDYLAEQGERILWQTSSDNDIKCNVIMNMSGKRGGVLMCRKSSTYENVYKTTKSAKGNIAACNFSSNA